MTDDRDKRRALTPPLAVRAQTAPPVPRDEFKDNPPSGVHGESPFEAIERRQRTQLSTAQTTLDTLNRHDKAISDLGGRITKVEGTTMRIDNKQDVQNAKLDTMLTILDPSAPERVKKIVHAEIETTTYGEQRAERAHRRTFRLTALQIIGGIVTALISAGALGALIHWKGC